MDEILEAYYNAVIDTQKDAALQIIQDAVSNGIPAEELVFKVIAPSVERAVTAFLRNDIVLSQHFIASRIFDEAVTMLLPQIRKNTVLLGTVVVGCAAGDFHGLGKKIVAGTLAGNLINVIDLGLNVSAESFVDKAVEAGAGVIGVSSMMVHTAMGEQGPRKVKALLVERNLSDSIKLIVGGAPYKFDDTLYQRVDADGWAADGLRAVSVVKRMLKEGRS